LPFDLALSKVRQGIQAFARHQEANHKYHDTITVGWVRLLATHREVSFGDFLRDHGHKLNVDLLHRFWSPEVLASEQARSGWVPPDRQELPAL
jgi:hypothetical protein